MTIVRLARIEDGDAIKELLASENMDIQGINWLNNEPFWAVAERDDEVVGCIQIVGSKPIGYINFLVVKKECRGKVTFGLISYALQQFRAMGVSGFIFFVGDDMGRWAKTVVRGGAEPVFGKGQLYIRNTKPIPVRALNGSMPLGSDGDLEVATGTLEAKNGHLNDGRFNESA